MRFLTFFCLVFHVLGDQLQVLLMLSFVLLFYFFFGRGLDCFLKSAFVSEISICYKDCFLNLFFLWASSDGNENSILQKVVSKRSRNYFPEWYHYDVESGFQNIF